MRIRILADGQYRLDDSQSQEEVAITRLDNELVREWEANDEAGFHHTLVQLIEHVHASGQRVPLDELVPSDMMVPAEDMTLAEAKQLLTADR